MATAKAAKTRKRKRLVRPVRRHRYRRFHEMSHKERAWRVWNHDLDTLMHQAVKNPALAKLTPAHFIKRMVDTVDELHRVQAERRPSGYGLDRDGRY